MPPKLSILIPSYNDEQYLEQCISSVLESESYEFEVLVCDDCSEDKSQEILNKIIDPRLKLVNNKKRLGSVENWLKCLELSNGHWSMFLGSDDFLETGTVDIILERLSDEAVYTIPMKAFVDVTNEILDIQCTSERIFSVFGTQDTVNWAGILDNINHDHLSHSIIPRELIVGKIAKLMPYSASSVWIYWIIAYYYGKKVIPIDKGAVWKRYRHNIKREKWAITENKKKPLVGISFLNFYADVYNSFVLSIIFKDLNMLLRLLFQNRYHDSRKGGFYGYTRKSANYYYPGTLINLLLSPFLIIAKKIKGS